MLPFDKETKNSLPKQIDPTNFIDVCNKIQLSKPYSLGWEALYIFPQFFDIPKGKTVYDSGVANAKGFLVYWETGGVSGGSCWESSNPTPYTTNEETRTEIEPFDVLLETYFPQVSYIQYRKIVKKCMMTGEKTVNEYYGNCTTYSYLYMDFNSLLTTFIEMGLLSQTA